MSWILIITFHVYSGAVPMKIAPFYTLAQCKEVSVQIAKTLQPDKMACIQVPLQTK